MIEKVVEEMRSKPFTMIMIIGLYVAVGFLWRDATSYAGAKEFTDLKTEVSNIKSDINKNSLEQQLRSIRAELFSLQRSVDELIGARKPVPDVYRARIDALISDRDNLQNRLTAIYQDEVKRNSN